MIKYTTEERHVMQPSIDWLPEERLVLISKMSDKIKDMSSSKAPMVRSTLFKLSETITMVAIQTSRFLETNREQIMESVRESE